MSKMKHLLRKLHIGTDNNNSNHRHLRRVNAANPQQQQQQEQQPPPPSSPPSLSSSGGSIDHSVTESGSGNFNANEESRNPRNFNFFEEEFQVQLAMALSVSDPDIRSGDDESDQIKAAKQLSLACSPSNPDNERLSEFISLKYWNYNVVQYDERVVDGFYDAYAIASNSITQGEMPLLVDLQAVSIFDKVEYEVMLVNRSTDFQLRLMENKVYALSVECRVLGHGFLMNGLIQRIANLVVDRMGGPVGDTEEMVKRWRHRTNQLKASLNTIVLPLGCLDVGLSRHRALLFKVLADKVNLPCMLVKGSSYTGTDDGAFNLIKFDDGSEYIIDLMGAPGTLIPSEVPSSILLDTAVEAKGFPDSTCVNNLSLMFDDVIGLGATISDVGVPDICGSEETTLVRRESKQNTEIIVGSRKVDGLEYNHGKPVKSDFVMFDDLQCPVEEESLAQEKKVKDVSKYVISAAKDPEFAQKLHAVLLESGASPPPDLFSNMSPGILGEKKIEQIHPLGQGLMFSDASCSPKDFRSKIGISQQCHSFLQSLNNCDNKLEQSFDNNIVPQLQLDADVHSFLHLESNNQRIGHMALVADSMIYDGATANSPSAMLGCDGHDIFDDSQTQGDEEAAGKLIETGNKGCLSSCNGRCDSLNHVPGEVCPMLGEFAEWEIRWEDLQIGERIGIGSYGEVYRADWNDTEVAVKKFLVQDFTTDVLNQFKCEAEMMIRLRHPNVVLFMGAVTRPPNLSILTEYLPRGSLYRLLHRSGTQIDEKKRMKMALDVARGMNYLHTSHPTIVHRDLKSPNLLVDKNWGVKVCDFGLSRLKHHTYLSSNSTAGTPEWMAPEVLRNEPSNEKCDVYSFGVILWELATLCVPWSGLNPMQVVGAVGFQNRRLQISEEVDPAVAQIIRDCWENDPSLRPSFSQLITQLKGLWRLVVQRD